MELTARDVITILKKNWALLLSLAIAGGLLGYAVSVFLIQNEYEATAMMIVSTAGIGNEDQSDMTLNDYDLNTKLVNSYSVLCKSNRVLSQVKEKLDVDVDLNYLSSIISVSSKDDTDIITISVTDTSPGLAQDVANTLGTVFQSEVGKIMKMNNVQIIDYARLPTQPVRPLVAFNTMIGGLIGLILALIIAAVRYVCDDTIKNSDIMTKMLDTPLIGNIPKVKD
jgi:capsular polysaccharide biosynthesis protein